MKCSPTNISVLVCWLLLGFWGGKHLMIKYKHKGNWWQGEMCKISWNWEKWCWATSITCKGIDKWGSVRVKHSKIKRIGCTADIKRSMTELSIFFLEKSLKLLGLFVKMTFPRIFWACIKRRLLLFCSYLTEKVIWNTNKPKNTWYILCSFLELAASCSYDLHLLLVK